LAKVIGVSAHIGAFYFGDIMPSGVVVITLAILVLGFFIYRENFKKYFFFEAFFCQYLNISIFFYYRHNLGHISKYRQNTSPIQNQPCFYYPIYDLREHLKTQQSKSRHKNNPLVPDPRPKIPEPSNQNTSPNVQIYATSI